MTRFCLKGSVEKFPSVGNPDTGTSDQEAACPLALESPNDVWDANADFAMPVSPSDPAGIWMVVYPSCADAWERRAKCAKYIFNSWGDPVKIAFESTMDAARDYGCKGLLLKDGNGRTIEEYPV